MPNAFLQQAKAKTTQIQACLRTKSNKTRNTITQRAAFKPPPTWNNKQDTRQRYQASGSTNTPLEFSGKMCVGHYVILALYITAPFPHQKYHPTTENQRATTKTKNALTFDKGRSSGLNVPEVLARITLKLRSASSSLRHPSENNLCPSRPSAGYVCFHHGNTMRRRHGGGERSA